MIEFDTAHLSAWVMSYIWPFIRIAAFISAAPIINNRVLPMRFKVAIAFFIAMLVEPTISQQPSISVMSFTGFWLVVEQIIIGVAIGFSMRVVFAAVEAAGAYAGLQMGLGFATFYDAASGTDTVILARVLNAFVILMFLAFNGHLIMIETLAETFNSIPLTADSLQTNMWRTLALWGSVIFSAGGRIAMPLIAGILCLEVAMGILNRSAPQFHIFSIGFAMKIIGGLTILTLMTFRFGDIFGQLFSEGFDIMNQTIAIMKK